MRVSERSWKSEQEICESEVLWEWGFVGVRFCESDHEVLCQWDFVRVGNRLFESLRKILKEWDRGVVRMRFCERERGILWEWGFVRMSVRSCENEVLWEWVWDLVRERLGVCVCVCERERRGVFKEWARNDVRVSERFCEFRLEIFWELARELERVSKRFSESDQKLKSYCESEILWDRVIVFVRLSESSFETEQNNLWEWVKD